MDGRKRGRSEFGFNGNGGFKKTKQEMESLSSGVGSKSKPCTKFFSTAGCPFGEGCHFLHNVPGGYNAVAQMINLVPAAQSQSRNNFPIANNNNNNFNNHSAPASNGSSAPTFKTRICNRFNSAEGCKFGDKCNFAHGDWEIGKPILVDNNHHNHNNRTSMMPVQTPPQNQMFPNRYGPPPPAAAPAQAGPASSFGASATAKISVDASLAGAIIGKSGVNSKQICRQTGAKLSIRDHETDANLRNIELEGTFEQIKEASAMVRELIYNVSAAGPGKPGGGPGGHGPASNNFKTKLCDNFTKGTCTFGERCHFAHGAAELRKSVV